MRTKTYHSRRLLALTRPARSDPHPLRRSPRLHTFARRTMSSTPKEGKLIFAPGETSSSSNNTTTDPSHTPNPNQAAQFTSSALHRQNLDPDPFHQFHLWFTSPTLSATVPETCTLSTASRPTGRVSSRTVYLKELDSRGFVIYSNWGTSQKARDFASNKHVALCFWWKAVERQVRVEGVGERLSPGESQVYFDTRARGSRVGAWASRQSEVLRPKHTKRDNEGGGEDSEAREAGETTAEEEDDDDGRAQLEDQVRTIEDRFAGQEDIPVPDFWGGLRVIPDMVEFWQGRESRLHDRFRYQSVAAGEGEGGGKWRVERLNP